MPSNSTARLLLALPLLAASLSSSAEAQIDGLVTEIVALDRQVGGRTISTVRIYAAISDPAAQLNAVYGDASFPLSIHSSDVAGFYQNVLGGNTSRQINPAVYLIDADVRLDSWVALGSEDVNGNAMLDVGLDFVPFNNAGDLATDNGTWLELPFSPPCYPVAGRVLVAQLSVSSGETVSGTVNLFGKDGSGATLDMPQMPFSVQVGPLGSTYCSPAVPNSTGQPARLLAAGSGVAGDPLRLIADRLPTNQFGGFLTGTTQGFIPNPGGSQGNLCVVGSIARFWSQIGNAGSWGEYAITVDTTAIPTSPVSSVRPGETWHFQFWYRDVNPSSTSNFTDAVAVTFH
jgi:hypothetical protein